MRRLLTALTVLFCLIAPVAAQDMQEPTCTSEQWQTIQTQLTTQIAELTTTADPHALLLLLDAQINAARATCSGGTFSKASTPNGIIGPIALEGTLYEVTLQSTGSLASMTPVAVEGECGDFMFTMPVMTGMSGGEQGTIYEVNNCTAIFKVESPLAQDWTLTINRLR